jgi:universal stress protein A
MISFSKILVPVDFSEASKKAVTYGLTLAARFNAALILAHIVPESPALAYAFPTETWNVEKEQYEQAKREIAGLVPEAQRAKLDLQTIVKVGTIEDQLLSLIKEQDIRLVVMGRHGRHYPGRWFLGSVTEHMLRKIPVPLLTVSHIEPEAHQIGVVSFKRILYATDLAESSTPGLRVSIELARGHGAEVTVIHVIDDGDLWYWGPAFMAYLDRDKLAQQTRKRLDDLTAPEQASDVKVEGLIVEGKPFRKIIEVAEERSVDLVVLNLQSKGVLERALLGATAERVVRMAHTPVLCLPYEAPLAELS